MSATGKARKYKHVLSIDGGGFRGYTCLVALYHLMSQFPSDPADGLPLPCQLFDVICGTSTGGLIAILLGRLGLDCLTAMSVYRELVAALFEDVDRKAIINGEVIFTETFEEKLFTIVEKYTGAKDTPFKISKIPPDKIGHQSTDTFVTVVQSTAGAAGVEPYYVRSYATPRGGVESVSDHDWTICEAIRAATALPGYFKPVDVGSQSFQDATLSGAANPVRGAISEVELRWSKDFGPSIVSLGTGLVSLSSYEDEQLPGVLGSQQHRGIFQSAAFSKQLQAVARDTELAHQDALKYFDDMFLSRNYIRFDPTRGLGDLSASDVSQVPRITALTDAWLGTPEGNEEVAKAYRALKSRYNQVRKQQSKAYSNQDGNTGSSTGQHIPMGQNDVSSEQQANRTQPSEGDSRSLTNTKSSGIQESRQDLVVQGDISSPTQQSDSRPTPTESPPAAIEGSEAPPIHEDPRAHAARKDKAESKLRSFFNRMSFTRKTNADEDGLLYLPAYKSMNPVIHPADTMQKAGTPQ